MTRELDAKVKTALDESRLLILGAQVLFGFAFQGVFEDLFAEVPAVGQILQCAALGLLCLSVGLLIAPSMYHRLACRGESRHRALHVISRLTGWSLLPLTLGLGASAYVVFDRMAGNVMASAAAGVLTGAGLVLLFGLGLVLRKPAKPLPPESATALKTKIEQLLTEARVIIPGGQALLGFQFVATLTKSFSALPNWVQGVHAAGLLAVALSVLIVMTPATLHRMAFHGEDDPDFYRIASELVTAAALPLAAGIAADILVVFFKISSSAMMAGIASTTTFVTLIGAWYAFPILDSGRHQANS
jgi:hypothetical protein